MSRQTNSPPLLDAADSPNAAFRRTLFNNINSRGPGEEDK
jgi:hypothetical protein